MLPCLGVEEHIFNTQYSQAVMAHLRSLLVQLTTVLIMGTFVGIGEMLEVSVKPGGCICPDEGYSCEVALAGEITWMTESNLIFGYSLSDIDDEELQEMGGFKVDFSGVVATDSLDNYTSQLFVTSLDVNGTDLTCTGSIFNRQTGQHELSSDTVLICLSAPASPPTGLSVVWDPPSAVVSFQSPVYGGECVDYYMVTALSEEENITCNSTSDKFMFNCTIPSDRSVYDFNFTVYSVTRGDFMNGGVATDCYLPSPYNVSVYEEECGLKYRIKWKGSPGFPVTTSIAVNNTNYETMLTDEDSHLTLDYSETGPVEISVTFSSHLCNKTTVILVNNTSCRTSTRTTPTPTSVYVGVTETDVQPTTDSKDTEYMAIGAGVGAAVIVVATTTVVLLLVLLVLFVKSKRGAVIFSGDKMNILGSPQISVEEGKRSCDPPQTPAPAVPGTKEESRPDVVPSLYAELDTLSRQKKEEPAALPMYHVLEGPTPVETTPDTQESETPATDAPVYSMVDKSKKKKKNKGSESSATATPPASDIPVYSMVDKSKKNKKNRGSKSSITGTEKWEEEKEEEEGEEKEEVTSI